MKAPARVVVITVLRNRNRFHREEVPDEETGEMVPGGNGPENGFWERGGDSMNIRCFDALPVAWVDKPARLDDTGGVPKGRPGEFSRRPISGECKLPLPAPRGSGGFPDQVRLRRFFPGLNRMVLPGGIRTSIPVRGFRPIPFFRGLTWKTPKPRNSIRSPFFIERFIASRTASGDSSR